MFNLEDYEPVEERLAKFWAAHPEGRVETSIVKAEHGEYIFRAELYRDLTGPLWATGYAHETVTERGVNSTSALENCETSSIGRALANAGFAAKGKRPSREEMVKASRQPSDSGGAVSAPNPERFRSSKAASELATEKQVNMVRVTAKRCQLDRQGIADVVLALTGEHVQTAEQLSKAAASALIETLKAFEAGEKELRYEADGTPVVASL